MFLDASAVLGILLKEDDHEVLLARLDAARSPLTTSPVAIMECVTNFASKTQRPIEVANAIIADFNATLKVRCVPITSEIGARAIRAFAQYGKPHKAQLNMGDCFAYACARNYGIP